MGVELSEYAAGEARKNYNLDVFCGELYEAGLESVSFAVVAIWDVIEHVPDPMRFLKEIVRLLKPDGYLLLLTDNVSNLNSRTASLFM